MNYKLQFSGLKYLMEHFHQDWKCEYETDTRLLHDFARTNPATVVERTIQDIHKLTAMIKDSSTINALFVEEWRSEPPYDSSCDATVWLKRAAAILGQNNSAIAQIRPSSTISSIAQFPALYLLLCQFDSGWKPVFETEINVLEHFNRTNARKDVASCIRDIVKLMEGRYSDDDINRILRKDFKGEPPYGTAAEARAWLQNVSSVLKSFRK